MFAIKVALRRIGFAALAAAFMPDHALAVTFIHLTADNELLETPDFAREKSAWVYLIRTEEILDAYQMGNDEKVCTELRRIAAERNYHIE